MKDFLKGLLSTINNILWLLIYIFVLTGVPIVFLLLERQHTSDMEAVLTFVMVALWGAMFSNYLKSIGLYSTSLYKRLKGEPNE